MVLHYNAFARENLCWVSRLSRFRTLCCFRLLERDLLLLDAANIAAFTSCETLITLCLFGNGQSKGNVVPATHLIGKNILQIGPRSNRVLRALGVVGILDLDTAFSSQLRDGMAMANNEMHVLKQQQTMSGLTEVLLQERPFVQFNEGIS